MAQVYKSDINLIFTVAMVAKMATAGSSYSEICHHASSSAHNLVSAKLHIRTHPL